MIKDEILLWKLYCYIIRSTAHDCLKVNVLSFVFLDVLYENVKSFKKVIACGLPQGVSLGTLPFIWYNNDLDPFDF